MSGQRHRIDDQAALRTRAKCRFAAINADPAGLLTAYDVGDARRACEYWPHLAFANPDHYLAISPRQTALERALEIQGLVRLNEPPKQHGIIGGKYCVVCMQG